MSGAHEHFDSETLRAPQPEKKRKNIYLQGVRMGAQAGTHAPDRKIYISVISIYQVYNTSVE